ncbi:hypothetical protein ACKUT9_13985 [Mycobacterium seoulense]|uniref:hypothetical protein n=1 Tax=Mycobacterium seoulense TaxID=386911 RepID=UPI003CE72FA4
MESYTPLDVLKFAHVEGGYILRNVKGRLACLAFQTPCVEPQIAAILETLDEALTLLENGTTAFCSADQIYVYSDGRPIETFIEMNPDLFIFSHWHPDPNRGLASTCAVPVIDNPTEDDS